MSRKQPPNQNSSPLFLVFSFFPFFYTRGLPQTKEPPKTEEVSDHVQGGGVAQPEVGRQ